MGGGRKMSSSAWRVARKSLPAASKPRRITKNPAETTKRTTPIIITLTLTFVCASPPAAPPKNRRSAAGRRQERVNANRIGPISPSPEQASIISDQRFQRRWSSHVLVQISAHLVPVFLLESASSDLSFERIPNPKASKVATNQAEPEPSCLAAVVGPGDPPRDRRVCRRWPGGTLPPRDRGRRPARER